MVLLHPFLPDQTKGGKPVDEQLTDKQIRENLEDLANQIDNITGGSGGGSTFEDAVGEIKVGGKDDVNHYWKKRFSPFQNKVGSSKNIEGQDFEGSDKNSRFPHRLQYGTGYITVSDAAAYQSQYLEIATGNKFTFKSKKGENFFNLAFVARSNGGELINITIDGLAPTALGLEDEAGNAAVDNFTTLNATTRYGDRVYYYGLDENKEQTITIENASASNAFPLEFFEVGFKTVSPTINQKVIVKAGRAEGRFGEASFDETELTFDSPQEGNANGQTAAVVATSVGIEPLNGESPAMTVLRPGNVAFSGVVTTLSVQNNYFFRSSGIGLFSLPTGEHQIFSWTAKTNSQPQNHSFDGVIWQSQPQEDFDAQSNFDGAVGTPRGDGIINYLGTAPIIVSASNNKLDFSITVNGSQTTHVATLNNGAYAADLMNIGGEIARAMQAVKPIDGVYFCDYDSKNQLWSIGCTDPEVSEIQFPFSTGVNQANSIHPNLGFNNTDLDSSISYIAQNEVQSLSVRSHQADKNFMFANDPRIKHSATQDSQSVPFALVDDIEERLGFGYARYMRTGAFALRRHFIHPEDDCTGLDITVAMLDSRGAQIGFRIDREQPYYALMTQDTTNATTPERAKLSTMRVTFPKGTRMIEVFNMDDDVFTNAANNDAGIVFVGCRQLFSKPAWESLPLTKSIIKTYEVMPISQWVQPYAFPSGNNYAPQPTLDNVDNITESTPLTANATHENFSGTRRLMTVLNQYYEVEFTITGVGGFMYRTTSDANTNTAKVGVFLNTQAAGITEANDRVRNYYGKPAQGSGDQESDLGVYIERGLPPGSYIVRIKMEAAGNHTIGSFFVIDESAPDPDKYTITDLANSGMGIPFPYSRFFQKSLADNNVKVPRWLYRSGYQEGKATDIQTSALSNQPLNSLNYDDQPETFRQGNYWASSNILFSNTTNDFFKFIAIARSIQLWSEVRRGSGGSTQMRGSIDNRTTTNPYSTRIGAKGCNGPAIIRTGFAPLFHKDFKTSCSLSAGLVYNVSDTRGIRYGRAILWDGTNEEEVYIVKGSIVTDASFAISVAPSVVVPANVTEVRYPGHKSIRSLIEVNDGSIFIDGFSYEPLPVIKSKALLRLKQKTVTDVATNTIRGITSGNNAYYPIHKDGIPGNWGSASIDPIQLSSTYNINEDLKNIEVGAGTLGLKLTSTREIPEDIDESEVY